VAVAEKPFPAEIAFPAEDIERNEDAVPCSEAMHIRSDLLDDPTNS
jgi:hypothetical protein